MRPYRTNLRDVPHVEGLPPEEGWINMQVQFLIDEATANSDKLVLGWTVLPPRARHERHRHFHAGEGDVVYTERGHWHGFNNTSDEEVVLVWGWSGAGSLEAAGYEVGHDHSPS